MKFKNIDIAKLLELMEKHETTELALKDGKTSIEIKRINYNGSTGASPESMRAMEETAKISLAGLRSGDESRFGKTDVPQESPPPTTGFGPGDPFPEEVGGENEKYHHVKTPLVGTFYKSPAPDAEPFVEVGDAVKKGDTLCIVEAMKNMNEIESDIDGIVKEICVQNAEMVEYDQVILKIEKNG